MKKCLLDFFSFQKLNIQWVKDNLNEKNEGVVDALHKHTLVLEQVTHHFHAHVLLILFVSGYLTRKRLKVREKTRSDQF